MTSSNRYTGILLVPLLLFNASQLHATAPNRIDQLEAEQEKLKSKTQAIKEQIQVEQSRIELLKQRIELFRAQNEALDQRILKEMQQYKNRMSSESNDLEAAE